MADDVVLNQDQDQMESQEEVVTLESIQQDLADLEEYERALDALVDVMRLRKLAELIEAKGTPEMKAKLKPFKDHYDGDVVTLLKKRTQQHFENDVQTELASKDASEKARYQQNPESYFSPEDRDSRMQSAYDKTVAEAQKLADSLQQVVDQMGEPASAGQANGGRRMFSRK